MMKLITIEDSSYLVEEEWKKIYYDGYDLNYEISNTGKVRNTVTNHIRVLDTSSSGYLRFSIRVRSLKKTLHFQIHRLVAKAFIPIPKRHRKKGLSYDDLTVNHINGNKEDNVVLNLEWCTMIENVHHAIAIGLTPRAGEKRLKKKPKLKRIPKKKSEYGPHINYTPFTIYTEDQIRKACSLIENGAPNILISIETGIPSYYLTHIRAGKVWKHISKDYKLKMVTVPWPKKTEDKICDLLKQNISIDDIIKTINVEDTQDNKIAIQKIKDKMISASTTIS